MSESVFIDTSALIALIDSSDKDDFVTDIREGVSIHALKAEDASDDYKDAKQIYKERLPYKEFE